jgi:autotransporter passenger strand-loop-strand repeat protein
VSFTGTAILRSGGVGSGAVVTFGGTEAVSSGGLASATVVSFGGFERISAGGLASATVVDFGGTETLFAGTAASAVLLDGGLQFVSSGGTASTTTVSSGATEVISSGGTSINTQVLSGGTEIVLSGGTAINTTVASGGTEIDPSAGPALVLSGGAAAPSYLGQATVLGAVSFAAPDQLLPGSGDTTILGGVGASFDSGDPSLTSGVAGFDAIVSGSRFAAWQLIDPYGDHGSIPRTGHEESPAAPLVGHDPSDAYSAVAGTEAIHILSSGVGAVGFAHLTWP